MAMNQFGAGFLLTARDLSTPVFSKVASGFDMLVGRAKKSSMGMAGAMRAAAAGMTAAGGSLTLGARKFFTTMDENLRMATEFGMAVAEVSTLIDEATFSTEQLRGVSLEMSKAYGVKAFDEAKGLYQVISAGITDAAEATKMLDVANKLAVGGVTDITTAVDGLTTTVNAYSAAGLDSLDVSDAFFTAIRMGKTTAEELSLSIGRVAPAAASLGISFDEMLGSVAAMTTQGLQTRRAVTGMNAALANILRPTRAASDEAKRLGIEFNAGALRSQGFAKFIQSVTKSANYNKDSLIALFGSIEGYNAMTALAANNAAKFNEIMVEMGKRTGATDEALRKMQDTFGFQEKRLIALGDAFKISIGESMERILAPALKYVNFLLENMLNFWESMPEGIRDTIVGVVSGLASFAGAAGGIMLAAGALGMLGVSLSGVLVGAAAFLLLMAPAAVLLSGFAVAAFAAYKSFQKTVQIGDSWQDAVKKIKLGVTAAAEIFRSGMLSDATRRELERTENEGVLRFVKGFERALERFRAFWSGLKRGFEEGVAMLDWGPLKEKFGALIGVFTGEEGPAQSLAAIEERGVSAGKTLASMGQQAIEAAGKMVDFGKKVAEWIGSISAKDVQDAIANFKESWKEALPILQAVAEALKVIGWFVKSIVDMYKDLAHFGGWLGYTLADATFSVDEAMGAARDARRRAPAQTAGAAGALPASPLVAQKQLEDIRAWQSRTGKYQGELTKGTRSYQEMTEAEQQAWDKRIAMLEKIIARAVEKGAAKGTQVGASNATIKMDQYTLSQAVNAGQGADADERLLPPPISY